MKIKIVEVGLRDGLQNETMILSTKQKHMMLQGLRSAGLQEIELTSFVHPKWIPALADAENFLKGVSFEEASYRALVPNYKGFVRAQAFALSEIAIFLSASETHNQKNVNRSILDSLAEMREWVPSVVRQGWKVRAYLSTCYGCPYEGKVSLDSVSRIIEELLDLGVYEVSLGDTIGVATPNEVKRVLQSLVGNFSTEQLAVHFHDTYGMAIANTYVAIDLGVTTIDSSIGGLGGCPYAPGASGNLATEDLVYFLEHSGIQTGINLEKCVDLGEKLEKILGKRLPSRTFQALRSKRVETISKGEGSCEKN